MVLSMNDEQTLLKLKEEFRETERKFQFEFLKMEHEYKIKRLEKMAELGLKFTSNEIK